jgi:hypothetical protein
MAKFRRLVLRFDGTPSTRSFTYHEMQKAFEIGINVGVLKVKNANWVGNTGFGDQK